MHEPLSSHQIRTSSYLPVPASVEELRRLVEDPGMDFVILEPAGTPRNEEGVPFAQVYRLDDGPFGFELGDGFGNQDSTFLTTAADVVAAFLDWASS
jgi:hypothetical protein